MKDFLKMTFAAMLGFIIVSTASTIISVIVFMALILSSSSSDTVASIDDDSVMRIQLSGRIVERSLSDDFTTIMQEIDDSYVQLGLDDLRSALRKAAEEESVKALYLECGQLAGAPAQLEELYQMVEGFKSSGKPIYAYGDTYTQGTYWIASLANKRWLNPQGNILITGMSATPMFYKRALEKLGVDMQIFKVGTFKSAVEPYILTEMSEANRLQMQQYLSGIWEKMKSDIGNPLLQQYADSGLFFSPAETTIEYNLVDSLVFESDVEDLIAEQLDLDDIDIVSIKKVNAAVSLPSSSTHRIAVLYADGGIDDGSSEGIISSEIVEELNDLRDNDKVKAVVLRINSPGGSAFGSEQMWYAAEQLRKVKPLIVSMSGYAASGGYYMACNADTIVAQHTTLTGSIGIFGMFPNVQGLTDKLGVDFDVVKTAEFADFGMITRPMKDSERLILQNHVNNGYELFTRRCADGRSMDIAQLKAIAEGRVWTGADALRLGLVDELGGLDRAVEIAAEKAQLANYSVKNYPEKKNFMEELLEVLSSQAQVQIQANKIGIPSYLIPIYNNVMHTVGIQALMPYQVVVE